MSVVAVCSAAGSSGVTTLSALLSALSPKGMPTLAAECDPSGGDLAAWSQVTSSPGWATAVAQGDRSFGELMRHVRALPAGFSAMLAPPRAFEARTAVNAAAESGFGDVVASMPEVMVFADCGRVSFEVPAWVPKARLTLLLLRQSSVTPYATAALVERTAEAFDLIRPASQQLGVVLVGTRPYKPAEVATALRTPLFGVVPDDVTGAGLVAAGGFASRRMDRNPLTKAVSELAAQIVSTVYTSPNGHVPVGEIGARRD